MANCKILCIITSVEFCCDNRSYSKGNRKLFPCSEPFPLFCTTIFRIIMVGMRETPSFQKKYAAKRSVEKNVLELQIPSLCDWKDSCMMWSIYAELFVCLCPLTDRLALDWRDKWLKEWCGDSGPGSWLWPVGAPAEAPPLGPRR